MIFFSLFIIFSTFHNFCSGHAASWWLGRKKLYLKMKTKAGKIFISLSSSRTLSLEVLWTNASPSPPDLDTPPSCTSFFTWGRAVPLMPSRNQVGTSHVPGQEGLRLCTGASASWDQTLSENSESTALIKESLSEERVLRAAWKEGRLWGNQTGKNLNFNFKILRRSELIKASSFCFF